jgi:hypothetical protein
MPYTVYRKLETKDRLALDGNVPSLIAAITLANLPSHLAYSLVVITSSMTYRDHAIPGDIAMVCQRVETRTGATLVTILKVRRLEFMFAGD